ncbi:MAG TPA: hypothetical protein VGM83_10315 [Devosiaceae bacterium]|jgi:hypothetical protein
MPLQNRVTPFGDIVAMPQRGMFTGNRGIIHDPATRTLLKRRWTSKAWIVCTCDFQGRRREVMGGRSWTELFFLDEATAFAAGHRPCFFCRRDAAEAFRAAWATGNAAGRPGAPQMDIVLHAERLDHGRKRLHALAGRVEDLPDGAMVASDGGALLLAGARAWHWTPNGYRKLEAMPRIDGLLTPPSVVGVLRAGYRPVLHESVTKGNAP